MRYTVTLIWVLHSQGINLLRLFLFCVNMRTKFSYLNSFLFLALAVVGTTTTLATSSSTKAWAEVIPGTEGDDVLVGTPEADLIVQFFLVELFITTSSLQHYYV
jgi:hypothetical protein